MRYHFTFTRITMIKKETIPCVGQDMEKVKPAYTAAKKMQTLWTTI